MKEVAPADEIAHFLRTGDHDPLFLNWPGRNVIERCTNGTRLLTEALLSEVRRREATVALPRPDATLGSDIVTFTHAKVGPMVKGLFPRVEQAPVLTMLERSLVFLTPESIESVIRSQGFLETARVLANIHLVSIRAEPLAGDDSIPLGLSEETTFYVSMAYFEEKDPFADFVVHEAAHVFHNTKRRTVGLRETRRREWLLPIEFRKRETFAYACETYSRILELARRPSERRPLLERFSQGPPPSDDRVEFEELLDILGCAVDRRNGWKMILERCSSKGTGR